MADDEIGRLNGLTRTDTGDAERASPKRSKGRVPRAHDSRAVLFRYLLIGGLSIVIDVSLLYILHSVIGVQLGIATAVAFLTSLVFNFVCNRLTMAGGDAQRLMRHAFRYGLLVVANLCITVAVVTGAEHIGVPYVIGKLAVVAASTCWNFVLYRRWVFADS